MSTQRHGVDLDKFYTYLNAQYVDAEPHIRAWNEDLTKHINENNRHLLHRIKTADQLHQEHPKLWNNLQVKVVQLPVSKAHGGGAAFVALVLEIADVLKVSQGTAYDILDDFLRFNNRRAAITSKASYRVSKTKLGTK